MHESYHGPVPEHCELVLQDVLTLHGRQFRHVDCIVASPPCQTFSYMAMPWSRAKALAAWYREHELRQIALTALFNACFRIQREACEVAGRHIPMVVENVKGAQPWVGRAKANFGSFYFWGDVDMVGDRVVAGGIRFGDDVRAAKRGRKVEGFNFHQFEKTGEPGGSFQQAPVDALKVPGISFSGYGEPGYKAQGFNVTAAQRYREDPGIKQHGSGPDSSRSDSRKAASAQIAKIPFPLSSYIARALRPQAPARMP